MTYGRRHHLTQKFLVFLAYGGPTGSETREFLKASARLIVSLTLIFFGLIAVANGQEMEQRSPAARASVSPNDATSGEFMYRSGPESEYAFAPAVETRVRFDVTGVIARATVIQRFKNPLDVWIEGVYVFPLPESSAVDHLKMRAGDRVIEGQIREKEEARREFDSAAALGKRATLVEQRRPNLFTSRVANLGPLEEVEVEIEYQQTLDLQQDRVSLRFPLAVTPRYRPAFTPLIRDEEDELSILNSIDVCGADLDDLFEQPPLSTASGLGPLVSIDLNLNAGFEVASLTSRTHEVEVEPLSNRAFRARLKDVRVLADRDFEISWEPIPGVMPQSQIATERGPDGTYALVTLFPPAGQTSREARTPREVTFVIDTSGSMEGVSMQQAKRALQLAIDRLDPADSFNLIEFNSVTSALFSEPVPATRRNLARAAAFAASFQAQGGTNMLPALNSALRVSPGEAEERIVRQVIFLTDGAVSNEEQLFAAIKTRLGPVRLFTIGIGSAPNSHFMTKAAEFGRGTFTFISNVAEVEKQMNELFTKIESPVLTDIQVSFDGLSPESAEVWPDRVPDLYLGEPVAVSARFPVLPKVIRVRGRMNGQPFETVSPLGETESGRGINVLWARRKIQSLLDGLSDGNNPDAVRAQVVSLGLTHHLVTRHTSLVAVDMTPVRPLDQALDTLMVPLAAPHGSAFGSLPQSATPAPQLFLQALLAWMVAGITFMLARRA